MWLRGFKSDSHRMRSLRALLARETSRDVSRTSADGVVDGIVELLSRGRLHLHAEVVKAPPSAEAAPPKPPPALFAAPPRMPPRPSLSLRPPSFDPPLFPANINLLSQASALVAAAADGAPFCPM